MKEFDLDSYSKQMPYRLSENFFDDMTERVMDQIGVEKIGKNMPYAASEDLFEDMAENVMSQIGLEKMGRQMPYEVPEDFFEDMTARVMTQIGELNGGKQQRPAARRSIWLSLASVACTAAAAALFLFVNPFRVGGLDIPDYDNLSQCASIDEMFQSVSTNDLGLYSMTSNYWGD